MQKWEIARDWALSRVGCPYLMGGTGQYCTPTYRTARMRQYPDYAEKMKRNCQQLKSGKTSCKGCRWYDEAAGRGKRAYDCAQLSRWCMDAVGINLVSGANSQWDQTAWAEKGIISQMPKDRLCLVYRWDAGKGKMAHVGIYLGDGWVVHAKGHDYGVVREALSACDFTHYGIPYGLYEGEYAPPTVRRGDQNQAVERMQRLLTEAGYPLPPTKSAADGCDGIFGPQTESALMRCQRDHGAPADGVCDAATWAALEATATPAQDSAGAAAEPGQDSGGDAGAEGTAADAEAENGEGRADSVAMPRLKLMEIRACLADALNIVNNALGGDSVG